VSGLFSDERRTYKEKKVKENFIVEPAESAHPVQDEDGVGIIVPEDEHFGPEDLYEEGNSDVSEQ